VGLDTVGSFPQTRECIREIMLKERIPIIGGSNGYYIATTESEVSEALDTLDSRITSTAKRKMLLERAATAWSDDIESEDDYDIL
ncbi:hypothetical protein, partial [Halorubrum sp. Atlit-26R]|uniref:hypothetical protein n=2 Tax=Haloferacaceae TaxID=1644056 RepID=UPI000EF17E32